MQQLPGKHRFVFARKGQAWVRNHELENHRHHTGYTCDVCHEPVEKRPDDYFFTHVAASICKGTGPAEVIERAAINLRSHSQPPLELNPQIAYDTQVEHAGTKNPDYSWLVAAGVVVGAWLFTSWLDRTFPDTSA